MRPVIDGQPVCVQRADMPHRHSFVTGETEIKALSGDTDRNTATRQLRHCYLAGTRKCAWPQRQVIHIPKPEVELKPVEGASRPCRQRNPSRPSELQSEGHGRAESAQGHRSHDDPSRKWICGEAARNLLNILNHFSPVQDYGSSGSAPLASDALSVRSLVADSLSATPSPIKAASPPASKMSRIGIEVRIMPSAPLKAAFCWAAVPSAASR
jgi:hypothetical protein